VSRFYLETERFYIRQWELGMECIGLHEFRGKQDMFYMTIRK
jgi:hypothetical protein